MQTSAQTNLCADYNLPKYSLVRLHKMLTKVYTDNLGKSAHKKL